MKKSAKLSILVIALLFIAGLVAVLIKKQPAQILFYSDSCPHCKIVEQYLVFQELEVSSNPANAQLLVKKAGECGLPSEGLGVPFFYDGSNCFSGDQDIIKYFSSKK